MIGIIKNGVKKIIADRSKTQVQADWNQSNSFSVDYIKNKPDSFGGPTGDLPVSVFENRADMLLQWESLPAGTMAVYPGGVNGPVIFKYTSFQDAQNDWSNIPVGAIVLYPKE